MSIYISLFHRLGGNNKVQSVVALDANNPAQSIRTLIREQRDKIGAPRLWNMSSWMGSHHMDNFVAASAISLEYKETHRAAVRAVLEQLDYKCFLIDTRNGFAVLFPLTVPVDRGQYVRLVAVLSTIIGSYGLSGGCQAGTFAFYPTDTAKVIEIGSDIIDTHQFKSDTFSMDADVGEWFKDGDHAALNRLKAQQKAQTDAIRASAQPSWRATQGATCISQSATASPQPSANFNDLFDRDDQQQDMSDRVGRLEAQMTNLEMLVAYLKKDQPQA